MQSDLTPGRPLLGLATLFVAGFVAITTETLPVGLLPSMSRALLVSEGSVGLLTSAYAVVVMVVTLPLVVLTSRWPRRRVVIVIMGLFITSNVMTAMAPGYQAAVAARIAAALGHGLLWSTIPVYAARLVTPQRAIATVFAANSASMTLGVPLGTVIAGTAGWRTPFALLSVLAAVVLVAAMRWLPDVPGEAGPSPGIPRALRLRALRTVLIATTLVMLGHFALYTYLAPTLLQAGLSESQLGAALFAFGLAGIGGVAAAGAAVDHAPRAALLTALAATTVSAGALVATRGLAAVAAVAVWGAAYAALPTLLQTLALRTAAHIEGAVSALFIITFNLSIAAGSSLGGLLLNLIGPAPLPIVAAVLVAAGLRDPEGASGPWTHSLAPRATNRACRRSPGKRLALSAT